MVSALNTPKPPALPTALHPDRDSIIADSREKVHTNFKFGQQTAGAAPVVRENRTIGFGGGNKMRQPTAKYSAQLC